MNSQLFHQWITRKYGFFTRYRRKYPTLIHLRFPQRKISLAHYLLIKHEHISIFPRLRTRIYSFNHQLYFKFNLIFRQYHLYSSSTSLRLPGGYTHHSHIHSEKEFYHYRHSHHSCHRYGENEHEVVQLFQRFSRLQSTGFPDSLPGKSPAAIAESPVYFFEPRRHAKRREEEKRRREVEGFPGRMAQDSLYQLMIMSKNIPHMVGFGKEAFFSSLHYSLSACGHAQAGIIPVPQQFFERHHSELFFFTTKVDHLNATAVTTKKSPAGMIKFPTYFFEPRRYTKGHEGNQLPVGIVHWPLARSEKTGKRRNEEAKKRGREAEGFPGHEGNQLAVGIVRWQSAKRKETEKGGSEEARKRGREDEGFPGRLEPDSVYRSLIMSKTGFQWIGSGKEAFHMAQVGLLRPPTQWGPLLQQFLERRYSDLFFFSNKMHHENAAAVTTSKSQAGIFSKFITAYLHYLTYEKTVPGNGGRPGKLRNEETEKRRNEETKKQRREDEDFHKRLEPSSIYQMMIMSRNISHVVDFGKESFYGSSRRGVAGMVKFPTYFFEPRRHAKRREEESLLARSEETGKRRNEETKKRRREAEGFPGRLAQDSLYQLMIMSKNVFHLFDSGKEAFHMVRRTFFGSSRREVVRRTLIGPSRYAPRRGALIQRHSEHSHSDIFYFANKIYDSNAAAVTASKSQAGMFSKFISAYLHYLTYEKAVPGNGGRPGKRRNEETKKRRREVEGFPGHEGNQLAVGNWQLARREAEGFPKRLEPSSIYQMMILSRNIAHVVDHGKEAFHMARRAFYGPPRRGVDPGKEAFHMVEGTSLGSPRRGAALDYFSPYRASVRDRDQSLMETGKPGFPAMDARDKISGEHIFGNQGSPGITGISQQHPSGIDIDQLSDRVYRVLEDKIRMEKEMRGW